MRVDNKQPRQLEAKSSKPSPKSDPFDKGPSGVSSAEKEGLKLNPELKARTNPEPKPLAPSVVRKKKSEHDQREEQRDAQSVPNSVFGQDRVILSPEAQMVPAITRKAEAVGVKPNRQRFLPPGLNKLAAKANPPAPPPTRPPFEEFVAAFSKNFT